MRKMQLLFGLLTMMAALALPNVAWACPNCQEAPNATSGSVDENGVNNAAAYNQSIYILIGVPYFTFGVLGFMIYRGVKKNEAFLQDQGKQP